MDSIRVVLIEVDEQPEPMHFPSEINCVGRFRHFQQFYQQSVAWQIDYDLVLINIDLSGHNAIHRLQTLMSNTSHARKIVICPWITREQGRALLQMGVGGILLWHEITDNLLLPVRAVHAGRVVLSPTILKMLLTPELFSA